LSDSVSGSHWEEENGLHGMKERGRNNRYNPPIRRQYGNIGIFFILTS